MNRGRYILFLDILGFSKLVDTKTSTETYKVIDETIKTFKEWEDYNGLFNTIYFSDSFVFYQSSKGYSDCFFLDIYAIGGMVLSALLAKGIPARGVISFGEFEVENDSQNNHQIFFGKALIEAYKAEQQENWIGISIQPSAWKPYEAAHPGIIDIFAEEKVWLKRDDQVLLLNPFLKLRIWHTSILLGDVDKPYSRWDSPGFQNDLLGLHFLREKAAYFETKNDFTSSTSSKYHIAILFLKKILGEELYEWANRAMSPDSF